MGGGELLQFCVVMVILCCTITTHLLGLGGGTGPGGRHADILHVHATANGYASVSDIHQYKDSPQEKWIPSLSVQRHSSHEKWTKEDHHGYYAHQYKDIAHMKSGQRKTTMDTTPISTRT